MLINNTDTLARTTFDTIDRLLDEQLSRTS